jgi:2-iminobutanoate/2-iminopropanoate deaminase
MNGRSICMSTSAGPFVLAVVALALGLPLSEGNAERGPGRSYFAQPTAPAAPSSEAVRSGNTLYLAGHLGLDPASGEAPADATAEAHLLMEAIARTVTDAGFRMDDLVAVTVFSTDLDLDGTFNVVYESYFHGRYPARSFVGAARLLHGAHFELAAIAVRTTHLQL